MVIDFFRTADDGLSKVEREVLVMLADCRHSFDLAMGALLSDADPSAVADEVRSTDARINASEESVRRELIVHTAVRGGADVGTVLGLLLIVKRLERVGDQAKNILNLAEEGVRFGQASDVDEFVAYRDRVSRLFGEAQRLLSVDEPDTSALVDDSLGVMADCEAAVRRFLHSPEPGSHAVPRAMLYRYLKRTAANVVGVVATAVDGLDMLGGTDLDE